eukprot:g54133.t1
MIALPFACIDMQVDMATTDKKQKADTSTALDEDDDFEEFQAETWGKDQQIDDDHQLWGDNWDDEDVDEDFVKHLRAELGKIQESKS